MQSLKEWWFSQSPQDNSVQSNLTKNQVYWFQCLGMFVFVFLQSCTKEPTAIHLQISFILMMAIPMCAKTSGAHYNPAVTLSNYLCRYNKSKFSYEMMWSYFKAQTYTATFALALAYIINDNFLAGLALPKQQVNEVRIFVSEAIATGILVFFTQLVANSETSFVKQDGLKYFFIISFVFVARKSAFVSSFAINPAITLGTVVMDILTCRYRYLRICWIYIVGDILGSIMGTLLYNKFYAVNLQMARSKYQKRKIDQVELKQLLNEKMESNLEEQSGSLSKNILQLEKQ